MTRFCRSLTQNITLQRCKVNHYRTNVAKESSHAHRAYKPRMLYHREVQVSRTYGNHSGIAIVLILAMANDSRKHHVRDLEDLDSMQVTEWVSTKMYIPAKMNNQTLLWNLNSLSMFVILTCAGIRRGICMLGKYTPHGTRRD
jgi:hypothetical protein